MPTNFCHAREPEEDGHYRQDKENTAHAALAKARGADTQREREKLDCVLVVSPTSSPARRLFVIDAKAIAVKRGAQAGEAAHENAQISTDNFLVRR
jgi:hypothetical protein